MTMSFEPDSTTPAPDRAVLLITAPDRKGLVARISDFIYRNNGNILHADHHIDGEAGLFLMRVEWDLAGFAIAPADIPAAFAPLTRELNLTSSLQFSQPIPRTALFVSKYDHCFYDVLLRERAGEFRARTCVAISNHQDCRPIAESFGVEYLHFPITPENKATQESRIVSALQARGIGLIVLARYMQILSDDFVRHFPNRIINVHHSFLPAFVGANPYRQAYQRGVKVIGATAHYVSALLDDGPIIAQEVAHISHRDSVDDLVRKGRDLEKQVLARALRAHCEYRVLVYGNKTVVFA